MIPVPAVAIIKVFSQAELFDKHSVPVSMNPRGSNLINTSLKALNLLVSHCDIL